MIYKLKNWIYDIILIILVASPTSELYYVLMVVATGLCIFLNRKEIPYYRSKIHGINAKTIFIIAVMIISCMNFVLSMNDAIGDSIFRAIVYGVLFTFFPIVGNIKIHNITIYALISYLFASQICYVLTISPLISYFSTMYPTEADSGVYSLDYLTEYGVEATNFMIRLGGYLYNPNACSRMYSILVLLLLAFNDSVKIIKNKILYIFIGFALIGILFSGSRSGLLIFVIIYFYNLYISGRDINKIVAIGGILGFLYAIVFSFRTEVTGDTVRAMQLGNGLDDSFSSKINYLITYLSRQNGIVELLFGHFNQHYMYKYIDVDSLDSEVGIAIFTYGFLGLIIILSFFIGVLKVMTGKYKTIYILFMWMLSSSLIFSFRTSMLFFFIISLFYSKSINLKYYGR